MPNESYIIVKPGDRIDLIAKRVYGDPEKYQLILNANPGLDVFKPQAGRRIIIPDAR